MSRIRRNSDLHTSQADSERLVLQVLAAPTVSGRKVTLPLSALGYAAYPGYSFKAPQGAALAAARLARGMADRGLIGWSPGGQAGAGRGYYVKQAGILVLENAAATDSSAAGATP